MNRNIQPIKMYPILMKILILYNRIIYIILSTLLYLTFENVKINSNELSGFLCVTLSRRHVVLTCDVYVPSFIAVQLQYLGEFFYKKNFYGTETLFQCPLEMLNDGLLFDMKTLERSRIITLPMFTSWDMRVFNCHK